MNQKCNIGIDIDNVISNFDEILLKEFLKHDAELRNTGIINENADYITRGMLDWSKEELENFYYANIERITKSLKTLDKAQEYIKKLKEEGYGIYIITGRDNGEYRDAYQMTVNWLESEKIEYDKLILTNSKNPLEKAKNCLENDISIMIDDSVRTLMEAHNRGIITLLMDTQYNRIEKNLKRVHNWKEIYEFIKGFHREKLNVILDTDTYNECDDQFALSYMLKSQDIFNVEAITVAPYINKHCTIPEGQENSYNEILKICKWLEFETDNKVFKGAMDFMINGYSEDNDAVNKIIEIALKNEKTYIMAIGAITNVALAIKKEPKIIDKTHVVWLGGHSFLQGHNIETNFKDRIAVKTVFDSKVKLTVIPAKSVSSNLTTSIYELEHFLKGKSELCDYLCQKFYNDGYHGIQERRVIWDISVIAYLIEKRWFESKEISCPNIKEDSSYEITENRHKITMVNYLDVDKIYTDLFRKLGG